MRSDVMAAVRDELRGYSVGKGCIRFPRRRPSDSDLDLVRATGASTSPVCWHPVEYVQTPLPRPAPCAGVGQGRRRRMRASSATRL